MRLILDFDGVIADLSERYYQVYRWSLTQLAEPNQAFNVLSKAEFWQLERQHTERSEIAVQSGLNPTQVEQYLQLRQAHAHALPNMVHDRLIDGSVEAMQIAKNLGWEIMTVTMRRPSELAAVIRLNPVLESFLPNDRRFTKPETAPHQTRLRQKPALLQRTLQGLPPATPMWMVGDTESDILAAQACQIPVIAVLSGIRDRPSLTQYQPDYIVENLLAAVQLIQTKL